MGNPQRNGVAASKLPANLTMAWQTPITKLSEGPLSLAWNSRLTSCISAPVAAHGVSLVCANDAGQVAAVNTESGREIWRTTVGARLDSPPTIHNGLAIVGGHDGWVRALRLSDGQLVWRSRVAPAERRMVAFGQVESVWPAIGSVVVENGIAYASAGRTSESDGGVAVCAFDAMTGQLAWATTVGEGPQRRCDMLRLRGGDVVMQETALDAKTGQPDSTKPAGAYFIPGLDGLLDGIWTRIGNRRSGDHAFGRLKGEMFVWDDVNAYGYDYRGRSVFCANREKNAFVPDTKLPDGQPAPKPGAVFTWRQQLPDSYQAEAMSICDGRIVLAGRIYNGEIKKCSGFIMTLSMADGKKIAEYPLSSAPAYQGLAIASQRLYVSLEDGSLVCMKAE